MSSAVPSPRPAPSQHLIIALVVLACTAVSLFAPQVLNDGDTYWHLATGDWILDNRAIPHADVFSHTAPGAPWQAHEWLSEVFMALAFRAGGWSGLTALIAGAVGVTMVLLARRLRLSLTGSALLVALVLAFTCVTPALVLRPHILTLPIIVAWAVEMLRARDRNRAPRLVFVLLLVLWANLHGSYAFAFLLAAPFGLEALLDAKTWMERRRVVHHWGIFALAMIAATAITPHGISGLFYPLQIMSMQTLDGIIEWRSADFTKLGPFEVALLVTLFACFRFPMKLPVVRLLLLLFLLHMALRHTRHLTMLGLIAPLILAGPLGAAMGLAPAPASGRRLAAIVLAGAVVLIGVRLALPVVRTDSLNTPKTAYEHVPAEIKALPVLNEYAFGGYLITKGQKVFIDGRADMYGDAFSGRYFELAQGKEAALEEALAKYNIGWTLFPPSHPVTLMMDNKPGWTRLHADKAAVVHVRE